MAKSSKKRSEIAALIESVRAAGDRALCDGEALTQPKGLSKARLAKLRLPNGHPVSGSLAAWLGYAHNWLDLVKVTPRKIVRRSVTLLELVKEYYSYLGDAPEGGEETLEGLVQSITREIPVSASTPVVDLPMSGSQYYFLALEGDGDELPVYAIDKEEGVIAYDSFGKYLDAWLTPDPPRQPQKSNKAATSDVAELINTPIQKTGPRRKRLGKKALNKLQISRLDDKFLELVEYLVFRDSGSRMVVKPPSIPLYEPLWLKFNKEWPDHCVKPLAAIAALKAAGETGLQFEAPSKKRARQK